MEDLVYVLSVLMCVILPIYGFRKWEESVDREFKKRIKEREEWERK